MAERNFDLASFKKLQEAMVVKEGSENLITFHSVSWGRAGRNYSLDEVNRIIESGDLDEQIALSYYFFQRDGLYKKLILYYATLLTYAGLLIPNPAPGKQLSQQCVTKQYYKAMRFLSKANLPEVLTRVSTKALVNGCYYGIITTLEEDSFVLFDLPPSYCRSRLIDQYGNDIVEFNVSYFDTITELDLRTSTLSAYPSKISKFYKRYKDGKTKTPWVKIPANTGVCFPILDGATPLLINTIPSIMQYDEAVDTERERELEEIRKILVETVPHLNDGTLLFEPEEALEMHRGTVNMMKGNKNISVLTTYAEVEAITSKTTSDNTTNNLEKMLQNVYSEAGASAQLFAPTGSQALPYSINNDTATMMILGNKYSRFISYIINETFGNTNVTFQYTILPVTYYNKKDFITDSFKLAQSGYSLLMPAVASGLSQSDFVNIKSLENDVLKLGELLIPPSSSYTQSATGGSRSAQSNDGPGAPAKNLEDKASKTIQNEESLDHQGGSNG